MKKNNTTGFYIHIFLLDMLSGLLKSNVWKSRKHDRERVASSLYRCRHQHGLHVWRKYRIRHEPTFFSSSLVKSEPTWLRHEELKLDLKRKKSTCFVSMVIQQPNEASRQKYWHIFYVFRTTCRLRFVRP